MNKKLLFNDGWRFSKSTNNLELDINTLNFEYVDIPHDSLIYNTQDLYENHVGWYRKNFFLKKDIEQVLLYFEGVYMDSYLYVNGTLIGEWKYGYSSFEFDISKALLEGDNEIVVKVVHVSPNSRWYSGAGIYRNVWLKIREKDYIETDGIYVSTKELDNNKWCIEIESVLNVESNVMLCHVILDDNNNVIAKSSNKVCKNNLSIVNDIQKIVINEPRLWSPENPNLYSIATELVLIIDEGKEYKTIESVTQNIGFKSILLDTSKGLILNGNKIKLNGVCEHHDLGALGSAFNKEVLKRRFFILKEMGVNAIRTAHNMPAPDFMKLADEIGFLVVSEAFDIWEKPKTPYDYARFFNKWVDKDVKSWIMRDRNHVSLLMWSIGNEIYDTHADEKGQKITKMLLNLVQKYDPKKNAPVTIGSNFMPWENAQKCADIVKYAGYNYGEKYYKDHHEKYPDWIIYGSETGSIVQSRGIYHFPFENNILTDDDEQCSALGNSQTSWGARSIEECILFERDTEFSLGQFIWTGFDYIGEPTPYHTKNSYFGQIDTATFKKDLFYVFQSAWTDYKKSPMIHIFPYWDFNEGQIIDVRVCSNAPKIKLELNNKIIDTYNINHKSGKGIIPHWKIPYENGVLRATALDENNNIIAIDTKKSFGDSSEIRLNYDKKPLKANGVDIKFIEIFTVDDDGNIVENASNRIEIKIFGEGRLLGIDNGDSTDFDQYKGLSKRLFSGKLMAIIASTLKPGEIEILVLSKGLKSKRAKFESIKDINEDIKGVSAIETNRDCKIIMGEKGEIPIRKIEIISMSGQSINKTNNNICVKCKLYPDDTSYKDVIWSITDDKGIKSNLATFKDSGRHSIKVKAIGDGNFRVRCMSKNGTNKIKLISQLEFNSAELGIVYKNPYNFISGGLYDYTKGEVTAGNERGISTSRDGETHVGFKNIDFGTYGSNKITIPIFALSDEKYFIQIWEGIPRETESELLADVFYQKKMIWNVYQEETYNLSKKLTGITSIYFVLKQKIHIKGFYFELKNKAFEKNIVVDCDRIYGDQYSIKEDVVENIGNNVSLEFNQLDFTEQGANKLIICGKSPIEKNTIHIHFEERDNKNNQIVEFTKSDNYIEKEFDIDNVKGEQKVIFVFLPGSNFDFSWFQFKKKK